MIFIKQLTNIDFAYLKKGNPFGETLIVDVAVYGNNSSKGLVIDFFNIKKKIRAVLDKFDHKVLTKSKLEIASKWVIAFDYSRKKLEHRINRLINIKLPKNVKRIKLSLRKETGDFCFFSYTHGLKFHQGSCYNPLHGHYNKFEIFRNGKKFRRGEKWIYEKYLAKSPYIADIDYLRDEKKDYYILGYDTYRIKVKKTKVIFIDGYPTIENIAGYFYTLLQKKFSNIGVVFYEGISKGCCLGQVIDF